MDQEAFFSSPLLDYVTLADMARELCVSIEHIKKLIEQRQLQPSRRHGIVRLWDRAEIETLRKIINENSKASRE